MEKELSSAEKSRKTKLSKKSAEELIDIVIRKDDIERRKDKLIACLKTNIAGLENKVSSIKQDLTNAEKEYTELVDKYQTKVVFTKQLQDKLKDANDNVSFLNNKIDELQEEIRKACNADIKCFVLGLFIGGIIFATIHYLV